MQLLANIRPEDQDKFWGDAEFVTEIRLWEGTRNGVDPNVAHIDLQFCSHYEGHERCISSERPVPWTAFRVRFSGGRTVDLSPHSDSSMGLYVVDGLRGAAPADAYLTDGPGSHKARTQIGQETKLKAVCDLKLK